MKAPSAGFSLVELLLALALVGVATGTAVRIAAALDRSLAEQAGARLLAATLEEAWLAAYRTQQPAAVEAGPGAGRIRLATAGAEHSVLLPAGVRVLAATRSGHAVFYPSGLSDNASWRVAAQRRKGGRSPVVILNQRSGVRLH